MQTLIDTHILIWALEGSDKLSNKVSLFLNNPINQVWVSHASLWEMSIKIAINKLSVTIPTQDWEKILKFNHYNLLDFDFKHYEILQSLPQHHQEPFDRMLIAQAIANDFTIITQDDKFKAYEPSVKIIWN